MLYLDASVLAKRYFTERGSDAVQTRFRSGERIFTSVLSYAEIHAALGRKYRARELKANDFELVRKAFVHDWLYSLKVLEMNAATLAALPDLVEHHPLKGLDAAHLSAALWLRDMCLLTRDFAAGDVVLEFGVVDRRLARVATACGLKVFNPEASA